MIAHMLSQKDGSELTYSTAQQLTGPGGELNGLRPEDTALKPRVDAIFDFCAFFASPALALILVLAKAQATPFGVVFIGQVIAAWLISLVLPFIAGFFAGADRQYINKRIFLVVWAHWVTFLLYAALKAKV